MTSCADEAPALAPLLSNANALLLDFDGPVCAIFASTPASVVAEELSVHPVLVRKWARGERPLNLDRLLELAKMGEVSLDELFGISYSVSETTLKKEDAEKIVSPIRALMP